MAPAARAATVLHAVLLAGLAAIGGAFILVMQQQGGPLVSGARGAAVLVWLLCEGAGSIGWVGYLITGMVVATVPAVLGLVALLAYGPSRLAGE